MTIIHYIPTMDSHSGTAPDYVSCLMKATRNVADSHVVTDKDLGDNVLSVIRSIKTIIKELHPDIIHIHSSWNCKAAAVQRTAGKHGLSVILSVHGGLAADVMEIDFWKQKLPELILYQFWMIRHCHALVAVSDEEFQRLKSLEWKKRIVLIPHPTLFPVNEDTTREYLINIYRKVIDTDYLSQLTEKEKLFTWKCVALTLWKKHKDFDNTTSVTQYDAVRQLLIQDLNTITGEPQSLSFRRIHLYAHDNGVRELMLEGAKETGFTVPPVSDIDAIPRFKPKKRKESHIRDYRKLCSVISEVTEGKKIEPELTISGTVSFHTLCELFCRMRFTHYDETLLSKKVRKAGISGFTSRLLNLIARIFHLEIGYMPLLPKDKPI